MTLSIQVNTNKHGYNHIELMLLARAHIRRNIPYLSALLNRMVFRPSERIPTLATSKGGVCLYSAKMIEEHNYKQVAWMIVHEGLHLFLSHFKRCGTRDPWLFNIAGDMAINVMCDELGLQAPNFQVCYPKDIGMANGLSTEDYYEGAKKKQEEQGGKDGEGEGTEGEPGSGGKPSKGVGNGQCGSCSGHAMDGEAGSNDADARSEREMERVSQQVAKDMRDSSKTQGKLPAGLLKEIEGLLAPARVPWQRLLAMAVRQAYQYKAGHSTFRFDGPNKKQAALGYGVGKPVLPRLRAPIPNVACAIDTSGSMWGGPEIPEALSEVAGILATLNAPVTFMACDAEVHSLGKTADIAAIRKMLKGGGGTDFRPVFEKLKKEDILVYFTDGYGTFPTEAPRNMTVIWVMVGPHKARPPWGVVIDVDTKSAEGT
jgi:predicted metal-dependent peptidase